MSLPLTPRQQELATRAAGLPGAVFLALETGTGKTRIGITAALLARPSAVTGIGMVAAQGLPLLSKWARELEDAGQTSLIIDNAKSLAAFNKMDVKPQWVLVNYSALAQSKVVGAAIKEWAEQGMFWVMLLDESHYLKGDTKRTTRWRYVGHNNFKRRGELEHMYMLSATPVTHSPPDLMNQFRVCGKWPEFQPLAAYITREDSKGHKRKHYVDWEQLSIARDRFHAFTLRCRKQEVFPPNILPLERSTSYVPLGAAGDLLRNIERIVRGRAAKRLEDKVAENAEKAATNKNIDEQMANRVAHERERLWCEHMMELLEYLLMTPRHKRDDAYIEQLASLLYKNARMVWYQAFGIFYQAEGEMLAKRAALSLVDTARKRKVAVYASHLKPLDLAAEVLLAHGVPHAFLTGQVPQKRREGIRDEFVNGDTQVLLCTYRAAAHGIEFTPHVRDLMMLQRSVSPAEMVQAENRIHRFQDTKEIVATRAMTCVGTIGDEVTNLEQNLSNIIQRKRDYAAEMGLDGTLN